MAALGDHPVHRPDLPRRHLGGRPPVPRHEVLPAAEPRAPGPAHAAHRRRGPADRHPAGQRRRDRAPGRHRPPRHQAGQRPRQQLRRARPDRLRHRRPRWRRHVPLDPAASGDAEARSADVGVSVPWAPPEVLYVQTDGSRQPLAERGDVYSLAATLWQLLVGRSPFEVPGGDNSAYALMPRIRTQPVPSTGRADVPPSLERILAQSMAKDPALRPGSALELARLLQGVEQQLHLARTPIVVLDDRGGIAVRRSRPVTGDATRVKSVPAGHGPEAAGYAHRRRASARRRALGRRRSPPGAFAPAPDRPTSDVGRARRPRRRTGDRWSWPWSRSACAWSSSPSC